MKGNDIFNPTFKPKIRSTNLRIRRHVIQFDRFRAVLTHRLCSLLVSCKQTFAFTKFTDRFFQLRILRILGLAIFVFNPLQHNCRLFGWNRTSAHTG